MTSEQLQKARDYEEKYEVFVSPEERPAFHLTPRIGWMNDPNGFCWYQGYYHLFYQYHPYRTKWGPMHWGHAVSRDLLHWTYLPCALAPDTPADQDGCFSGSAIEMPDGRHLLLYTGVRNITLEDGKLVGVQTQCVAVGDGMDYKKYPGNPILTEKDLPEGGNPYDFRDPRLWREADGSYAMIVGNRPADGSGSLLIYRSDDCLHWRFDCVLDQCYNEFGKMWECPEYFPLDGKEVILTSPQDMSPSGLEFHSGNGSLCLIGTYDRTQRHFIRESVQAIDYGIDFYAAQTVLTPDGRRVMIAWMQNWDTCVANECRRWFGQMTIPRELSLRDGRLCQNPIREIEAMRGRCVQYKNVIVSEEMTLQGVFGRRVDMTVSVRPLESDGYLQFKLKVARGSQHYTLISYKPRTSVLRIDRRFSGCHRDFVHERKLLVRNRGGEVKLRVLLDRFSVEVFVNDGEQAVSTTIETPQTADGISFEAVGQLLVDVEKYELQ